jgi:HEAT repeat protein
MSTFEVTQDDGKSTIEELIHKLQISPVEQKCAAADSLLYRAEEIIQNESLKNQVSDALVAALSDMGEENISGFGMEGSGTTNFYVRENAVKALAKITQQQLHHLLFKLLLKSQESQVVCLSQVGLLMRS